MLFSYKYVAHFTALTATSTFWVYLFEYFLSLISV